MSRRTPPYPPVLTGVIQPVRIGFIPVADCAPLLVAESKDLFRKHGVRVELSCEVGWATIREKLLYNQVDAVHAIAGLALAMRLGLSTPPAKVVAPFVFNLHGNAITLSRDLWNRGVRDAASLRKLIRSTAGRLTFGVVSRYSSHCFLLRRWLAAGGIDADKDVRMVTLPPMQMTASMKEGLIDGYCVGEPWNSAAVEDGCGWIVATSEQLAPGHAEKVLLTTESFIERHPDQARAIIAALKEACAYCDVKEHRPEVAHILAASGHFSASESILKRSLVGPMDLGTGHSIDAENFHIFHRREANEPLQERGRWLLTEFLHHGIIPESQRQEAIKALRECWGTSLLDTPSPKAAANKPSKVKTRALTVQA